MMDFLQTTYDQVPSVVKTAVAVGGVTLAAPYLIPLALYPLGFTATGVASGTAAAAWQSTMGGSIVKGGLFSMFQQTAMTAAL